MYMSVLLRAHLGMCVHMYVCIYMNVHTSSENTHTHLCMYTSMHTAVCTECALDLHASEHTWTFIPINMQSVRVLLCVPVCEHLSVHLRVYTCTSASVHTALCMCTHMCGCLFTCGWVHMCACQHKHYCVRSMAQKSSSEFLG